MEQLNFDAGVREWQVNGGGVLRMNPGDPNLYVRFLDALERMEDIERELVEQGRALPGDAQDGRGVLALMAQADRRTKALLAEVFPGNDFDALLGGVNLLAVASNGERVVTNLMAALQPILTEGAETCAASRAEEAAAAARAQRERRRAAAGAE